MSTGPDAETLPLKTVPRGKRPETAPSDEEGAFESRWGLTEVEAPVDERAGPQLAPTAPLPPLERELSPDLWGVPDDAAGEAPVRRRWWHRLPWDHFARVLAWVLALGLLAGAGAVSWWLIEPQLGKPFVYDEAAFSFAGRAVAQTGLPLSNVGYLQFDMTGDFSKRFNWALWHPPLYVFSLGWAFRQWGETEQTARLLGVACNALAALFAFGMGTIALWGRTKAAPLYAAAGTALYVTNPYVIQSALLLDIDGTVLVASIALLGLLYTLMLRSPLPLRSRWTWLLMGMTTAAFALSLWAKMTTAFALPVCAALYRLVATRPWQPWRALVELPLIPGLGGALYIATWWAACLATGMPFDAPFRILAIELHDARGSGSIYEKLAEMARHAPYVALWVSPYLLALFIWAGVSRLWAIVTGPVVAGLRRARRRPAEGERWGAWVVDFPLAAGGAILAVYLIKLAASFPKYHISMMPFVPVAVAFLLHRYVRRIAWWEPVVYGVVLAGMAGYFVTFVGDSHVLFRSLEHHAPPLLLWPAGLGAACMVLAMLLGRRDVPRQAAIALLLLTVAWSWGLNQAQRLATYSTAYSYGTFGQREAARHVDALTAPGELYVAARDVAYYARNDNFMDEDTFWLVLSWLESEGITTFDGTIGGRPIHVLALFLWDPDIGTYAHSFLERLYEMRYQDGPYKVFVRKGLS